MFGGCGSSRFLTRFSTRNGARAAEGPKSGAQLNDPMLFFSPEGDTPPPKKNTELRKRRLRGMRENAQMSVARSPLCRIMMCGWIFIKRY